MIANVWLIKSEPFKYPWSKMLEDGRTFWDGVRNHQAKNNLLSMRKGDFAFFYHSNEGMEIVGVVQVVKEAYPDPTAQEGPWVVVDVVPVATLPKSVTLAQLKADPICAYMALVRQSRLSVCSVSEAEFRRVCELADWSPEF
jgi:predicted RNA-binding protein with PUA-like domain